MIEKVVERIRANPERFRALVLAVLILAAGFVPGLPVDAIDAVVVAFLALAVGEGGRKVRKARRAPDSASDGP